MSDPFDPGRMRHRVTLQRKVSEGDGPAGDEDFRYETDRSSWAEIEPLSGRELVNAAAIKATTSHRIRMRVNGPIGEGDRLIFPAIRPPAAAGAVDILDIASVAYPFAFPIQGAPETIPPGRRIFNVDSVLRMNEVAAYYEILATEDRGAA